MRNAFVALASLVVLASASGCTLDVTAKTKTRFVSDQKPVREIAYTNQTIEVLNDGPNPNIGAGIVIVGAPGATKVTATSDIVALADDTEVENAKTAHKEVIDSFTISEANGKITVRCGHSTKDYGTASQSGTGCAGLTVTVPAGTADAPVSVVTKSGNGSIEVSGITGSLNAEGQGAGTVAASVTPAKGSTIALLSDFDVTLKLPANFSADNVVVEGDPVDVSAFSGLKSGAGFGTAGTGAASISVRSTGVGKATITKQ